MYTSSHVDHHLCHAVIDNKTYNKKNLDYEIVCDNPVDGELCYFESCDVFIIS